MYLHLYIHLFLKNGHNGAHKLLTVSVSRMRLKRLADYHIIKNLILRQNNIWTVLLLCVYMTYCTIKIREALTFCLCQYNASCNSTDWGQCQKGRPTKMFTQVGIWYVCLTVVYYKNRAQGKLLTLLCFKFANYCIHDCIDEPIFCIFVIVACKVWHDLVIYKKCQTVCKSDC